jgi:hypothetical protein
MQAAQRRVRMIARVLAETCIKELYLGLHALIRENAEAATIARLNGKWVPIDPTSWGERNAMTIEVGLGAAGREADLAALNTLASAMNAIVVQQGGAQGPIVTLDNAYNAAIDLAKALGRKQPERYFTDPKEAPPAEAKPDPNIVKAQIQAQTAMQKAGIDAQVKQQANQTQAILKQQQTQAEAALKKYEIDQSTAAEITTAAMDGHVKHKIAQVGIGGNHV